MQAGAPSNDGKSSVVSPAQAFPKIQRTFSPSHTKIAQFIVLQIQYDVIRFRVKYSGPSETELPQPYVPSQSFTLMPAPSM